MNPFDNVSAEEGVQDKRPKRTYRAQQGHNGRFIDNVLDMSDGLHAEDITPVEKALIPMPRSPALPSRPRLLRLPRPSRPLSPRPRPRTRASPRSRRAGS